MGDKTKVTLPLEKKDMSIDWLNVGSVDLQVEVRIGNQRDEAHMTVDLDDYADDDVIEDVNFDVDVTADMVVESASGDQARKFLYELVRSMIACEDATDTKVIEIVKRALIDQASDDAAAAARKKRALIDQASDDAAAAARKMAEAQTQAVADDALRSVEGPRSLRDVLAQDQFQWFRVDGDVLDRLADTGLMGTRLPAQRILMGLADGLDNLRVTVDDEGNVHREIGGKLLIAMKPPQSLESVLRVHHPEDWFKVEADVGDLRNAILRCDSIRGALRDDGETAQLTRDVFDNGDGTITDAETGKVLMTTCAAPEEPGEANS